MIDTSCDLLSSFAIILDIFIPIGEILEMSLEQTFNKAAEEVKKLSSASNDDKLELYGYFKQAKEGDCSTEKPGGLFNQKEKAKWQAWNSKKVSSKCFVVSRII
ncbi:Putative acyl-CoA-binding protein [Galdieria sulphuraria]|nr:Putative acyl-CoA-binding protein [Galdieria sulphuraria]